MSDKESSEHLFLLANRVLDLIKLLILFFTFIVLFILFLYLYLIFQPQEIAGNATSQLKDIILTLWNQLIHYIGDFIRLITPVFVLLFALGVLGWLGKNGASPFETAKFFSDLPSALAMLIIATICLLPLAGINIPEALNNISLVVVGFYFGKRNISD